MVTDTHEDEHSARRIHRNLGGTTPFFRGFSIGELLLFACLAFGTLIGATVVPSTFTLPIIGLGVMLCLVLLLLHKVKPAHLWLTEWLAARITWAIKNKELSHGDDELLYLPRLERIYPHAIERTDGALVGAMRVTPANMALEDEDAWERAVHSLSEFVNASIDFPAKIYITSREMDQDEVVRDLQARLGDADVRSRPVLKRLIEEFIDWHTDADGAIDSERTLVRDYYIVTAVRDEDVEQYDETGDSVLAYLADVPVVGRFFDRFQSDGLSDAERERLKEEKLESRLEQIRRGGSSLYRCAVSPVDSYDLARATKEYWTNRTEEYGDITNAIGTFPVVNHGISDDVPSTPDPDDVVETLDADTDSSAPDSSEDDSDDERSETPRLDRPGDMHKSVVAPSDIDRETTYTVINGETYTRTFWIEQFPEEPANGMLERLLLETDLQTDISIHLEPFDSQSASDMMADWISDLKVDQHDSNSLRSEDLQEDIDHAKFLRSLVRANKASFFRAGVFIRLTADSKQALKNKTTRLRSIVKEAPANCTLKTANRWQEKGLATVSPLGANELGHDRMSTMTNQAIGAMFPFSSNYLLMDEGIKYGYHGHNGSPVRINPWDLDVGHSELVVGTTGAGKTFGELMRNLGMMKRHDDTMLVLIDPVGDFRGVADALNAKTITVGGDTNLNPLEIRKTPAEVLEQSGDVSPLSAKKDESYAIIENFLSARGIEIGAESGVLSYVLDEGYRQAGAIEGDISTHTPENSPTMLEIHRLLSDISESPGDYDIADSDSANDLVAEYADKLAIALQPFRESGAYQNLSKQSDIDILEGDNKVVYIDLGQIEGTASGIDRQQFMMQLLLSTIYQQAKRTDRNVELAIDEAHYLFEDQANLDFLETAFRHQRHAGLRIILLSQTAQEFYETEQAEKIIGMCPIKVFHKLPDLSDEIADKVGLSSEQRDYVRRADSGEEERGYSQALVHVEEHGTYPLHIEADEFEKRIIEYEPDDRRVIEQAIHGAPEAFVDFQTFVEEQAHQNALTNRYGLSDDEVDRLLDSGLSTQDLLDAAVSTLRNGADRARADGGETTDD
ncbi:conjugation protein [Haloferax elongans ATCC BAA-1513]|uniref:Conjugation protein n=1 Tax=Haloferax elongans ATCC BAA-1513 TaxID=1230453 RepID=M0I0B9_HALEO|nr:TraM recognition domain-containing protein [Haloferax elongans]ELZ88834.1 conjugation protein [Haloferax elongans ATCC BAA-1513]